MSKQELGIYEQKIELREKQSNCPLSERERYERKITKLFTQLRQIGE